ncbi:hypothetical protein DPMN_152682 [Dreissena polymorpha]|uniref:Uncharacterized protein n=1 Tax=Dreissena polymorpha TaxID=45954 RepID=A0A9D4FK04_DREPO|nr:hypothetical protein DPMN_152682 [Dreissena polymorpha]
MMLGREVYAPVELAYPLPPHETQPLPEYVHNLEQSMVSVHEFQTARKCLSRYNAHMKRGHDVRICQNTYRIGDLVYVLNVSGKKSKAKKLWTGSGL